MKYILSLITIFFCTACNESTPNAKFVIGSKVYLSGYRLEGTLLDIDRKNESRTNRFGPYEVSIWYAKVKVDTIDDNGVAGTKIIVVGIDDISPLPTIPAYAGKVEK